MKKLFLLFSITSLLFACSSEPKYDPQDGLASITAEGFESYLKVLASDEFQGRMPFTEGETKTISYLQDQVKKLGLEPGNGESYIQEVPMVEITTKADSSMKIQGKQNIVLTGLQDYVIWTPNPDQPEIKLENEELIFAGYGVVAPEKNWNDYAGLDVKGKVVLVMVNDPDFGTSDSTFKGNAMTYYGRWTYKFEEAARQGAKACIIVHDDVPAGYGFWVVQNS